MSSSSEWQNYNSQSVQRGTSWHKSLIDVTKFTRSLFLFCHWFSEDLQVLKQLYNLHNNKLQFIYRSNCIWWEKYYEKSILHLCHGCYAGVSGRKTGRSRCRMDYFSRNVCSRCYRKEMLLKQKATKSDFFFCSCAISCHVFCSVGALD